MPVVGVQSRLLVAVSSNPTVNICENHNIEVAQWKQYICTAS